MAHECSTPPTAAIDSAMHDLVADYALMRMGGDASQAVAIAKSLEIQASEAMQRLKLNGHASTQGSVAKGTTVGNPDIDIFLVMDIDTPASAFDTLAGAVALEMNLAGIMPEQASHPYVTATVSGYPVDIVPCYNITDIADMKSAVDRTPLHTRWFYETFTPELTQHVRRLKAFFKGIQVYGADTFTGGFSGYACEVLIAENGTFTNTLQRLRTIRKLIDPVDSERNILGSVSAEMFERAFAAASAYLNKPELRYFEYDPIFAAAEMEQTVNSVIEQGYNVYVFDTPSSDAETAAHYRALFQSATAQCNNYGFQALDRYFWDGDKFVAVIIAKPLSPIRISSGPDHSEYNEASLAFLQKWTNDGAATVAFDNFNNRYVAARAEYHQSHVVYMTESVAAKLMDENEHSLTPEQLTRYVFMAAAGVAPWQA